ncbi:MAG TPA: polysaccharide biosynthesis tyrosine autokinase, partial [Ferruginibacter sp.]|nr:polysaccharide biosynthesis tyrosine autokinase [Ferruginibacter sp.]
VLLKDPQKSGGDSKVLDQLNIFSEKKTVENEIIVLKSNSIMRQVVQELDLYATIYNEGNVQTEELFGGRSPLQFIALNKDSITEAGKYPFSIDWEHNRIKIDNRSVSFNEILKIGGTSYQIIINPNYPHQNMGKNYFVIFSSVESAAGRIIGSLKAAQLSYSSSVIDVGLETPVPEKGVKILTKLFEKYNIAGIEDKNQIATKTLKFIEDRLNTVIGQLDSVERQIQEYKSREAVADLSSQASMYFGAVKDLDKEKTQVLLEMEGLNDIQSYVNNKSHKPGTVPSLLLVNDPVLSNLVTRLYEAEFDRDRIQTETGPSSEAVRLSEEKVLRIKKDLLENLGNIRKTYQDRMASIDSKINENFALLKDVPEKERGLLEVNRQQAIKNNIYTYLLQKREETALSSASTSADLRILESGNWYGPIRPVAKNYYLIGFVIGLFAFLLYVQVQEQFNNKILFRAQVEDKSDVPVVAEILQASLKSPIAISDGKRTVIAEQFRTLRTNLGFMGLNDKQKAVLVTSSISGEGKSFIATNLALSITLTGKRVALLEMDLRKPKLSKELGIKRDPGITSYLIGKATLDEIAKPTAYPNLYLVTAGPIPPNPTELIQLPEFKQMIEELKSRFDYIIIDSAPIGPVTDAQLLTKYAETTIYVVRHAVTPTFFIRMIQNLKRENRFNNMCVVFNGIKPRGVSLFNYGFGGYGNGYGYGYGYGYGGEDGGYYVQDGKYPGFKNIFGFLKPVWKIVRKVLGRR